MKRDLLKERMRLGFDERQRIMFDRNEEYAQEEDALINFKRVAAICEILRVDVTHPEDCALFFRIVKMDRQRNLWLSGVRADNEKLKDARRDDPNYFDIEDALIEEAHGRSKLD